MHACTISRSGVKLLPERNKRNVIRGLNHPLIACAKGWDQSSTRGASGFISSRVGQLIMLESQDRPSFMVNAVRIGEHNEINYGVNLFVVLQTDE